MKTRRNKLILLNAVIVIACTVYHVFHRSIDIDACLDQGGQYDYSRDLCQSGN